MKSEPLARGTSLSDQVLDILIKRIRDGEYQPESQLPPENDLAAEFGVSRATVRTAISTLAARGLVVRRQGVGTFISQLSGIATPLNQAMDFHELITSNGYESGVELIHAAIVAADEDLAAALQIDPGDPVVQSHKIMTADGNPVIYCINSVPGWALHDDLPADPDTYPGLIEPLYDFLRDHCGQQVEYHVARLRADLVQNCRVEQPLPYDPQAPILVITEVGYNAGERPVFHAIEYYPGDHMTFELIRRRGPIG